MIARIPLGRTVPGRPNVILTDTSPAHGSSAHGHGPTPRTRPGMCAGESTDLGQCPRRPGGRCARSSAPAHRPHSSRSVVFRLEIGSLPRRDRSGSAPRSVHFRAEIGPRGSVSICRPLSAAPGPVIATTGSGVGQVITYAPSRRPVASGAVEIGVILRFCDAGRTVRDAEGAQDDHCPGRNSARRTPRTDLGAEPDRSRAGSEPISVRNRTDLGEREPRARARPCVAVATAPRPPGLGLAPR